MSIDERAWFGDPDADDRKKRVPESAAARAARAHGARPFPYAAAKVLTLTASVDFDVAAVIAVLESDAPMAARILRVVNSPAFGLRNRCRSIKQAVPLLGSKGVREAAIAGSVLNLFPGDGTLAWNGLHDHATMVGALARRLAPEWRLPGDEMFTAAFLHDIGKWILLEQDPAYAAVLADNAHFEGTLESERAQFGFDHAELTQHMLAAWQIPAPIPRIVGMHHDPATAYAQPPTLALRVAVLRLADRLAHAMATDEDLDFDALAATEPLTYLEMPAQSLRERYTFLHRAIRREQEQEAEEGNEPRATVAGSMPPGATPMPVKAKEQEVCALCDQASFGYRGPRCDARLCGDHHPTFHRVCDTCEEKYARLLVSKRIPTPGVATAVGVAGFVAAVASAALDDAAWFVFGAGVVLVALAIAATFFRFATRSAFLRDRATV